MVHVMFGSFALLLLVVTVLFVRDKLAESRRAEADHQARRKMEKERHETEMALTRTAVACRNAEEKRQQWIHARRVEREERGFE
jgi:hypothetical protein